MNPANNRAGKPCPKCKTGSLLPDWTLGLAAGVEYTCVQCGYSPPPEPLPMVRSPAFGAQTGGAQRRKRRQ